MRLTTAKLRSEGIATEIYLQPDAKLEKQLKYADKKGIPYVIIQGPDEITGNVIKVKDMKNNQQEIVSIEAAAKSFGSSS